MLMLADLEAGHGPRWERPGAAAVRFNQVDSRGGVAAAPSTCSSAPSRNFKSKDLADLRASSFEQLSSPARAAPG